MKTRASCRYLTHPYPAFLGCTLDEVVVITGIYLITDVIVSVLLNGFFGYLFLFFVGFFSVSLIAIRLTCRFIGSLKENKQPGYLRLRLKQALNTSFGFTIPFVTREGQWLTRRSVL